MGKSVEELLDKAIEKLKENNKIFVSEKDFQVELAYAIKMLAKEEEYEKFDLKLEYCPYKFKIRYRGKKNKNNQDIEKAMHIDILIIYNSKWYPIELKYKTEELDNEKDVFLKKQGARDQGRCNFLWDISRIEQLKKAYPDNFAKGFVIFITNDKKYTENVKNSVDEKFSLGEGRNILANEELSWNTDNKGTIGGCPVKIIFEHNYTISWTEFMEIELQNGRFFILKVPIYNDKEYKKNK